MTRMRLLLAILLVGVPLAGADFGVIATETEPPITIALPGTPATPAETDSPVAVTEPPVTVIAPPVAVTEPPVPPPTEEPAVVTPATVAPTEKTVVIDPPPPPPTEDTIVIEPPTPPPTEEGGDSPVVVPPSDDGATTGPQWQWHTFNFTFRLYSDSMPTVDTGLLDVRTALEAQLSGDEAFVDQADLPSGTSIELDDLGTVKQGPCGDSETNTPFEGFPVCNIVNSDITIKIARPVDDNPVNPELLRDIAFAEVRHFADEFNEQSEIARMTFDYPIHVKASMTITLRGVPNKMSKSDQRIFLSLVETGVLGILETNKDVVEFEMDSVSIVFQESSSGARRQLLRSLQDGNAADGYNKVHVAVSAVCGNPNSCTDEALQKVLDDNGAAYGDVLEVALKAPPAGDSVYFQNVQDVSVGKKNDSLPQLPPITVYEDEDENNKGKFPKWLGIIVFCSLLVAATLICIDVRRRKNKASGEKLDDYEEQRKRELEDDSEYSERENKFQSEEVQPSMNFTTLSGADAVGDDEDAGSFGDEFSLDGHEPSLAGPDQDAQFEPDHKQNNHNMINNSSSTDFAAQSFRAPRRTRNVSRGTSKRYRR